MAQIEKKVTVYRVSGNVNIVLTSNERAMFTHLLEKRMEIYPDVMDIKRIVSIIGYNKVAHRQRANLRHNSRP